MKSGTVALVGRPNAGKSTLLNQFVGQKVAIVSDKPQTTRWRIVGVKNRPDAQMVFVDTPGIHKPLHRMNRRMVDQALEALREVDVVLLVIDALERSGQGDRFVLDLLQGLKTPVVLALNKIDRIRKPELLPMIAAYSKAFSFRAIVPISALQGDGLEGLEREIVSALPENEPLYDADYFTDQSERTLAAELIREKVLLHTRDELPYSTAVLIDRFDEPASDGDVTKIFASIVVDQESQKPIVIGRRGELIKTIGIEARRDLEAMLDGRVFLDLHVKVREQWRDDERTLDELGLRKSPRRR